MNFAAIQLIQKVFLRFGVKISSVPRFDDALDEDKQTYEKVMPYTMTSRERIMAMIQATRYIVTEEIPGSIVECGVWRGGSIMSALFTLKHLNETSRQIHLFDTYEGMTAPGMKDGNASHKIFANYRRFSDGSNLCRAELDDVRDNVSRCGYPEEALRYIKGKVEDTIPDSAPDQIALLRLDTDWYESTRHELEHLFPRLSKGGILIIDDYGTWKGSYQAVNEYFNINKQRFFFLHRIDDPGRIMIKY